MNKFAKLFFLSMALVLVLAACGGAQDTPEDTNGGETNGGDAATEEETETNEDKSIVLGLDPYNFSEPPVYLMKQILEDQGYDVEIQKGQVGILWAALAEGEIDTFSDIWDPNVSGSFIEQYEGEYVTAGTLYEDAPVGAVVPTYMEDVTSIDQLNDMKEVFDGTLYTIDKGSGTAATTDVMVEEYDLDYEVVNSGEAGMIAQAQKLMSQEKAVVFIGWRPHSMFQKLDIKLLDDPKNVWEADDIKIGVASDLEERLPEAFTILSNMKMSIDEIERWLVEMEDNDVSPEDLAKEWVENNADTVEEWISE